jgi:hypothetical protein
MHRESPHITETQIQYLPSLLSKLEEGDIRIPPFQRPFVWKESQVLELLESIFKGFPIGVLYFWVPDETIHDAGWSNNFLLPNFQDQDYVVPKFKDRRYTATYVLDGVQRLSSLYGVFNWKTTDIPAPFNIVFDLRNERFLHYRRGNLPEAYISLSALFTPKRLFEAQRQLEGLSDSDMLIERAIILHSKFQEYRIPVITIMGGNLDNTIEIFERINTRGTSLTLSDLITNLVTANEFKINEAIESVDARLNQKGFQITTELFIKALAVILDKSPTPHGILSLRELQASELFGASQMCGEALANAADFLRAEFKIFSFEVVPYEEQILVLAKLFSLSPSLPTETIATIRRWFWKVSFGEHFRGKRTGYLMNYILNSQNIIKGDLSAFNIPLDFEVSNFLRRNLIKGRAFSLAVIAMLAVKEPRSLITGEQIDAEAFMREIGLENFADLFSRDLIESITERNVRSVRLIANTVVVGESERKEFLGIAPRDLIDSLINRFGDEGYVIMGSQFISPAASKLISDNNLADFLNERAKELYEFAVSLANNS